MKELADFLERITTLEIPTDKNGFLDLSKYRQLGPDDESSELRRLQQRALIDLNESQSKKAHSKMMSVIQKRFESFWSWYLNTDNWQDPMFMEQIKSCFTVFPAFPTGKPSLDFFHDLHDAAMYKEGFFICFMDSIKGGLKHKEIALIYFYDKRTMTINNASKIAKSYGWVSKTSGNQLYEDYFEICKTDIAILAGSRPGEWIERLENIMDFLTTSEGKENALRDLRLIDNARKKKI